MAKQEIYAKTDAETKRRCEARIDEAMGALVRKLARPSPNAE